MNIVTSADALARATYNALLYTTKTPPWDMCMVVPGPNRVSYLTSDSYALSWAEHPVESSETSFEVAFKILRSDLVLLEERARIGKKERVTLEFTMNSCGDIWYHGEDKNEDLVLMDIFEDSVYEDTWDTAMLSTFRELISEREADPQARKVMVATRYLHAVGRLKKDKDQGADLWISGEDDPVLIKTGPGHRLLVEPIDRERHKKALGEDATW